MTITHGSTFSGIGAPEIAAEMLGWKNVFHCEINPFGRKVLDYYFQNSKSYEDITKTDFTEWRGKITVLTGGFPCQPFSYSGKRRGSEDDRYLWPYMLRCIEQVRPTWFVGENVAGITTMAITNKTTQMGKQTNIWGKSSNIYQQRQKFVSYEIIENLKKIGYSVQLFIIPACAVGAYHRRDRVFIVAHRLTENSLHSGQLDREHDEQGCERNIGNAGARGAERIYREALAKATFNTPSQRRREIYEQVQSAIADGTEPIGFSSERNATNTEKFVRNDSEFRIGESEKPSFSELRRSFCKSCSNFTELLPYNRWRAFPTQSPIHRGNDGIPFDVDSLTIPFRRWKRECLKAYGNAIVPQVMYEIFRIIDIIENG